MKRLLLVLLLPLGTNAEDCTTEYYRMEFNELEHAVVWSLGRLIHFDSGWEHSGVVVVVNGKFVPSVPKTEQSATSVQACWTVVPGSTFAATFHTHTIPDARPSSEDRASADATGLPMFIAVTRGGAQVHASFRTRQYIRGVDVRAGTVTRYDPTTGETETIGTIDATDLDGMRFERAAGPLVTRH